MLEDFEYDALTLRAPPQRTRWYTRLWPACLGHGCFGRKRRQQFTLYLIGYDPVGELHRAASVGDVASVERLFNGSEHHVNESDRRGRHSENPAIPSSLADDKGNTSAIKDEETNPDAIRPEPPEDGILPQPTTENEIKTTSGPTIDLSIFSIKYPGEPRGPLRIPPPKPPRTKRQAPQKLPLSPTLQPRNNSPGPPRSLSPPLPPCVPAWPPHQDEETNPDAIRPEPPEDGILPQPTTENEIKTTSGEADRGEPTGPRRIPPPKPPRTKRQAPQKPPLSPTLQPRNNTPGPPRSLRPLLPPFVPARPPHQDEETNLDGFRPEPPEDGILPQPTTENEIKTTSGEPRGPRRIPPPKPPRTKRQAPPKPPLSPTLQPRNNTPGPPRSLSPPLPSCVPARPPHQDEETNLDGFRPEPPEDGILPQPTTENEIKTTSGKVFAPWAGPRNPFAMGPLPTTPDAATAIDSTPLRCQAAGSGAGPRPPLLLREQLAALSL
ncbi:hypothetical protein LEMLEM_LOCUS25674 [Lemmus lemmus]